MSKLLKYCLYEIYRISVKILNQYLNMISIFVITGSHNVIIEKTNIFDFEKSCDVRLIFKLLNKNRILVQQRGIKFYK